LIGEKFEAELLLCLGQDLILEKKPPKKGGVSGQNL